MDATIIWDLEDDPDGNVQHLQEHDVTIDEAEEVLLDPQSSRAPSRSSGLPTAFGWTPPVGISLSSTNWWTTTH